MEFSFRSILCVATDRLIDLIVYRLYGLTDEDMAGAVASSAIGEGGGGQYNQATRDILELRRKNMARPAIKEKYLVDETGKTTAVVLDIKGYQRLLRHIEDLEDALELDEAIRTAKRFRSYDEIRRGLKKDGRL